MTADDVTADADECATPDRLLDAAERLIAERGIDAVSARAINAAAGANTAALHYHFGSKEALVRAVVRRRADGLARRRLAMLHALHETSSYSVRAVAEALVTPLAEFSSDADGPGRAYLRVLAALQGRNDPDGRVRADTLGSQFDRLDDALARALPELPAGVRRFRLRLAGQLVVENLAYPDRAAALLGGEAAAEHAEVVAALLDAVTATLTP